jgi:hypothetical protein
MTDEDRKRAIEEGKRAVDLFREGQIMFLGYDWHIQLIRKALVAGASHRDLNVTAEELGKGHGSFYHDVLIRQAQASVKLLRESNVGIGGYLRHIEYIRHALCTGVGRDQLENVNDAELDEENEASFRKRAERVQASLVNCA